MKVTKTIGVLSVLIIAAMLVQDAVALPSGSYVDGNGKSWQGYKTYTQDGYNVVLEWAVYNIAANPWAGSVDFSAGDQYIYAYQLFSNTTSTNDVGSFGVLDIGGNPISQTLMHETQAVANGQGITPDPNPSALQGEWKWTPVVGFITAGEYSAYLIFSSVYAPTTGSFEIKAPEEGDAGVPGEVPEPGILALFGIASAMFAAKRGEKRQAE
ncbi:MAG: PEP-CTERM sorting domain-containing protein [Sedimentisphaerales bacterium]